MVHELVVKMESKVAELRDLIAQVGEAPLSVLPSHRIGIGITTHNRPEVFKKSYSEIVKYSPGCKIVVVDDASVVPVEGATFRFSTNVGIAVAKNKCFELLDDCDHIFLFDDDTFPTTYDWYLPYVMSKEPHLMYIFEDLKTGRALNDTAVIYSGQDVIAYSHPRGCMCYFDHICLTAVGGMSPQFGRWGWEHPDLSNRIFNAGLTSFRYMDVPGSSQWFYSGDENATVASTVGGAERQKWINRNQDIYSTRKHSAEYVPYKPISDLILTCYYTGVVDPQRGQKWTPDTGNVLPLINSVKALNGPKLVILSDCMQPGEYDGFTVVEDACVINPYFQRWLSYGKYLRQNPGRYTQVFCVDATDVEVLQDPFKKMVPEYIYCGSEESNLSNEWMTTHHRNPKLLDFFKAHQMDVLLNAGILGGPVSKVAGFCGRIMDTYAEMCADTFYKKQDGPGDTDMGVFNYVLRKLMPPDVLYGSFVNTRFKADERNSYSWFKHK